MTPKQRYNDVHKTHLDNITRKPRTNHQTQTHTPTKVAIKANRRHHVNLNEEDQHLKHATHNHGPEMAQKAPTPNNQTPGSRAKNLKEFGKPRDKPPHQSAQGKPLGKNKTQPSRAPPNPHPQGAPLPAPKARAKPQARRQPIKTTTTHRPKTKTTKHTTGTRPKKPRPKRQTAQKSTRNPTTEAAPTAKTKQTETRHTQTFSQARKRNEFTPKTGNQSRNTGFKGPTTRTQRTEHAKKRHIPQHHFAPPPGQTKIHRPGSSGNDDLPQLTAQRKQQQQIGHDKQSKAKNPQTLPKDDTHTHKANDLATKGTGAETHQDGTPAHKLRPNINIRIAIKNPDPHTQLVRVNSQQTIKNQTRQWSHRRERPPHHGSAQDKKQPQTIPR
ncbi:hypothetical protein [Enterobacter hormaechei]|uniref:hypothetical protein n=1 Tax=Enterobacter hormaechei TaxID=158836 RepID=UPI0013B38A08|nr:hypothetical protein [Enterobacter hormaechei]